MSQGTNSDQFGWHFPHNLGPSIFTNRCQAINKQCNRPPPNKKPHANNVRQEFFCENFPNWGLHQTQPPQKTTQTFSIWESQTKQKSHLGMLNPTQDASVTSPPGFWHSIMNHVYGRHLKSITKKTSSTTSLRSCNCQDVLIQILGPPSSKSLPIIIRDIFS